MRPSAKNTSILIAILIWSGFCYMTVQDIIGGRQLLSVETAIVKRETFADCLKSGIKFDKNKFVMQPDKCADDVDLVWLIKSSIFRNSLRKYNRQSWGRDSFNASSSQNKIKVIKRIFLVGSDEQQEKVPILVKESEKYKDILQGEFADIFSSATFKVVMGMKFVKEFCSSAKYVIVADDDAAVLPWNLFPILPPFVDDQRLYTGFFTSGAVPIRDVKNKWYMSVESFACPVYPTYTMGTLYAVSSKAASSIFDEAMKVNYLPMDDIFIGGLSQTLKFTVAPLSLNNYVFDCAVLLKGHTSKVSYRNLVVCHGAETVNEQMALWSEFCYTPTNNEEKTKTLLNYCQDSF